MDSVPKGQRFSHVYLSEPTLLRDSPKVRFRVAKLVGDECPQSSTGSRIASYDYATPAQSLLERELGTSFATRTSVGLIKSWERFFDKISIPEFLDSVTIIARHLQESRTHKGVKFLHEVKRIFKEESLAYHFDDLGGLHPLVDSAFSATIQLAIVALRGDRYTATAASIDLIDENLLQTPPNYVGAIRAVFGANENLFKLMYNVPRLDAKTAGEKLGTDQQSLYNGQFHLQAVSSKTLSAFKAWIDAAHFYRHEQGVAAPTQPAEELAILMISQGVSYVRWLAQVDKKSQP